MIQSSEIADIVGGKIIAKGNDIFITNILIDSRKINHPESSIFIPIVSDRRNAHAYLIQVYESGVRCFFTSEDIDISMLRDAWIIRVENTIQALQKLIVHHRLQFQLPVIGITGSNGKTIVKEWLYQLLESDYKIVRSPKSFNSQIGVPLSVWQLNEHHNIAIFEAGISQPHEMIELEKMIRPTIGIFTNIGETHNEGFLNMRHKINEKLLLFSNATQLIYCCDNEMLHESIKEFNEDKKIQLLTWSQSQKADLTIAKITKERQHSIIKGEYNNESVEIAIPFTDDASIEDSIHCWLLLLEFNIPNSEIYIRMQKLAPIAMRLELMKGANKCTIINDSYNSDVSSFSIALDFLLQQNQHFNKVVILSDIFQSGREEDVYKEVANLLKQKKIHRFIGIGEALYRHQPLFESNRRMSSSFFKSTDEFLNSMNATYFHDESILIKGARKFEFEKIAKELQERIHQTVMEINLDALIYNYKTFQKLLRKKTKVMAMVKAFSYGSGSYEVANKLQFEGVDYLAVAYTDEGIELRKNGITLPIMVMNADENSFSQLIEWKLEPEIYNQKTLLKMLEASIEEECVDYPIHLKLDTGMHRLGFEIEDLDTLINVLQANNQLKVVSVFSHLSGSEEAELDEFTKYQASTFIEMSEILESKLGYAFLKHLCNSSAISRHPELQFDMVRLGLGLYGLDSSLTVSKKLRTVSKLKTTISQIKNVPSNETVGYNRKGILKRDTKIGTVCVGYADGIPRRLGNGVGKMLVNNQLVPIVGNVCMDMCMLDITDVKEVNEGDTVIIFGETISVNDVASWAGTIPYEILTGISQRVKRIYFEE